MATTPASPAIALAAAPASPLVALPQLTAQKSSTISTSNTPHFSSADDDQEVNETQLSQDLALFLANPSLRVALADGSLDLASYKHQVHVELQELETKCIAVYRERANDIHIMRKDLQDSQSVLASLHEMLLGFQADLGGLSGDIRSLQQKSRQLDVQLNNRRLAKEGLEVFLAKIVVAPNLFETLVNGTVIHPQYLQAVQELQEIYKNCHESTPQAWACNRVPSQTLAGQELQEQLTNLRNLTVTRVRDAFLQQMALLRRPQTNIRMIQVHGLLKYAALQDFLQDASPVVANEILNVYFESMSKTLAQLFRTYQGQLLQLDKTKHAAIREDVIAIEDAVLRDSITSRAKKRVDLFCLGKRAIECLEVSDDDRQEGSGGTSMEQPIVPHVALSENQRYHYERLFRSLISHLCEAVTNEHVFCRQFFKRDGFAPLFHTTLSLLLEQMENYLFTCYDALCLLLMIKVTHSFKRQMRSRKIHSLDSFFDQVTKLLWPRLKSVMDNHLKSIKTSNATKLGTVDLHPHYVTRRFAEFACSVLLVLHSKAMPIQQQQGNKTPTNAQPSSSFISPVPSSGSKLFSPTMFGSPVSGAEMAKTAGDKLLEDLLEMNHEFMALLERLSDEQTTQIKRVVFLINNLDLVVSIFQERRVVGREFNFFVEHLMRQREMFVEEELLATGFSKLIAFVQQTEAQLAATPKGDAYDVNVQVVESLVLDFASQWKTNIELINRNVLSYFSNFRNGMEILKQVLTQLLLYYTRFHDIIRKVWRSKPPAFCKELVSTNVILSEIKKYALAI